MHTLGLSCEGDGHPRDTECEHNGKHMGGRDEVRAWDIQREVKILTVLGNVLVGPDDRRSRGGAGIVVEYHREPLEDPLRWGDPHDRRGALDLDYPELKLS